MPGQLLEDDIGVYSEGTVLHEYLGYREALLPAHHESKQKLHGVCGLLEKEVPRVLNQKSQQFYLHDFFLCCTLHRDNLTAEAPEAWDWQFLHLHHSGN